jgi:hypothetical protein
MGWLDVLVAGSERVDQAVWILAWVSERPANSAALADPSVWRQPTRRARVCLNGSNEPLPRPSWPPVDCSTPFPPVKPPD